MQTAWPIAAILALSACTVAPLPAQPLPPRAQAWAEATAGLGGKMSFNGVRVAPLELIEDSRCPASVQCVWAGRVRVRVDVDGQVRELTLGEPIAVRGGRLTLASANPPKAIPAEIPPAAYSFTFRFES